MNMIYDSPHYCVVEFSAFGAEDRHPAGGYEIVDKDQRREIFLGGAQAETFRRSVEALISDAPSVEEIDDFLANFADLMTQPVTLH
ncbi:MAG TPA: DUF3567 domain-containing protein [Burkholderiaceae bacterium]|nr:DUF3567 domain-containing protein [Burkholderiaceae bacterium]